jgi:hypothetical protein
VKLTGAAATGGGGLGLFTTVVARKFTAPGGMFVLVEVEDRGSAGGVEGLACDMPGSFLIGMLPVFVFIDSLTEGSASIDFIEYFVAECKQVIKSIFAVMIVLLYNTFAVTKKML